MLRGARWGCSGVGSEFHTFFGMSTRKDIPYEELVEEAKDRTVLEDQDKVMIFL